MKCDKCGRRMRSKALDYREEYLGKEMVIEKVSAWECTNCGNIIIDDMEQIEKKLFKQKLRIISELENYKPILISKMKQVRTDKNLSQSDLSRPLKCSMQRFGSIERNTNTPTVFTAMLIAYLMDQDINDLYKIEFIPIEFYNKILELDAFGQKKDIKEKNCILIDDYNELKERFPEYKTLELF